MQAALDYSKTPVKAARIQNEKKFSIADINAAIEDAYWNGRADQAKTEGFMGVTPSAAFLTGLLEDKPHVD
jgi:hypothetical protein